MLSNVSIRDGHDNFFTPLRIIFALMVVIGHSFAIGMHDIAAEPFLFFHYKPSYLAVNLFFIASGFLVTKSMLYRGDAAEYGSARLLRIYPALIVHVLFVMFVMGPFVTNLPLKEFFTNPQLLLQPFMVLSFVDTEMVMPGALLTNDEQIASAPLWTLRYEILAYIGTLIAFSFGLMKRKWMLLAQFVVPAVLWIVIHFTGSFDELPATVQSLLRFGLSYGLGAALYAYRDRITFNIIGIPIIGLVVSLFYGTASFEVAVNIWLAYILFWGAYVKIPSLNRLQSVSDISYGIYIYHWCLLQWFAYKMPSLGMIQLMILTLIATLIVSVLSWNLIEKPMLRHKTWFAKFLRFGRMKPREYNPAAMLAD